jgi:hypothetical protein
LGSNVKNQNHLIEKMLLFEHQGVWHLMAVFENHSVQVFDFETGMSMFEFHFADRNSEENS